MSVWNASNKICHFLRSSRWPMTKKLSAPKSVTHLVNKKVTDAELKESKKLRKQVTEKKKSINMPGIFSPRNCCRS